MMWFVYVLICQGNRLYTGITTDIEKRYKEHQIGKGAKFTKSFKPQKIVYTESHDSHSQALKREREIKSWTKKQKIEHLKLGT